MRANSTDLYIYIASHMWSEFYIGIDVPQPFAWFPVQISGFNIRLSTVGLLLRLVGSVCCEQVSHCDLYPHEYSRHHLFRRGDIYVYIKGGSPVKQVDHLEASTHAWDHPWPQYWKVDPTSEYQGAEIREETTNEHVPPLELPLDGFDGAAISRTWEDFPFLN